MSLPRLVLSIEKTKLNAERLKTTAQNIFTGRTVQLYYALKANYHPEILSALFACGIGAEVGRLHELNMLTKMMTNRVIINGHYKSLAFLEAAIKRGIERIYIESFDELMRVEQVARSLERKVQVGIRVKIFVNNKVGADEAEIRKISLFSSPFVSLTALHFHLGWNEKDLMVAQQAISLALIGESILAAAGHRITVLNIGGSLAEASAAPNQAYNRLQLFSKHLPAHIMTIEIEPGRYYVGDCGILYAQVEEIRGKRVLLNTCAYGYRLTGATPAVDILSVGSRSHANGESVIFSGHWAAENDVLVVSNIENMPHVGDTVRFRNYGAYVDAWFDQICLDKTIQHELSHPFDQLLEKLEFVQKGAGSILIHYWDFLNDELRVLPSSQYEHKLLINAIEKWLYECAPPGHIESQLRLICADYVSLKRALRANSYIERVR